ncbi:MAG: diguanylate cyclase [Burkholderiaceae bacterium]|nr:diguanylate cyclase [Burkholderiaceae bacterium]
MIMVKSPTIAVGLSRVRRDQFYGGLAILVAFVIAFSVLVVFQLRQQAEMRVNTITQNMARSMEQTLSGMIDIVDLALQVAMEEFERELALEESDRQVMSGILIRQQDKLPMPVVIRAMNEHGDIIYGKGLQPPFVNLAQADSFQFHRGNNSRSLMIPKPFFSPLAKDWIWVFSRRLNKPDGSFAGMIYAYFSVSEIGNLFRKIATLPQNMLVLQDRDLKLVAGYVAPDRFYTPPDDKGPPPELRTMLDGAVNEGSFISQHSHLDSVGRMYSYVRNNKYDFVVSMGVTPDVAYEAWRRQAWVIGGMAVAFILMSLAFAEILRRTWRRQDAAQRSLLEAQQIAQLGQYMFDAVADRWTSSEILDDILGIDANYPRNLRGWANLLPPEEREAMLETLHETFELGRPVDREMKMVRQSDGRQIWVHAKGIVHKTEDRRQMVLVGTIQDITQRKLSEDARRNSEDTLQRILDTTSDGFIRADRHGRILEVNAAYSRMIGYSREELLGMRISDVDIAGTDDEILAYIEKLFNAGHARLETVHRRKDGSSLHLDISITTRINDNDQFLAFLRDISERKQHEKELESIAYYDILTKLPNRRLLYDRLNQAIARSQRHGTIMAVCYLDLDNFKPINDQHGHNTGDLVLTAMAANLGAVLRAEDTLARLGGDEFILLLTQLASYDDVHLVLERVLEAIRTPISVEGTTEILTASIGVTLYPVDNADADALLRHADQAMYRAKEAGRNCYRIFDPEQDKKNQERQLYISQIRDALERQEFELHYQPKVDMLDGRVVGMEALIRWQHPERGLLYPDAFLGYLDGTEMERAVGEWVIDAALRQVEVWDTAGLALNISVNISATHLLQDDFAERLRQILDLHPAVSPTRLELEILESAALSDMARAVATLNSCRELGVMLALDDFGTGYSSLTYCRSLPVHTLKIDQTFVRDMLDDPSDMGIVVSVLQLAKAFDRIPIAEGVETLEHGEKLMELGCSLMQGYGIARPMPAEQVPGWVAHWSSQHIRGA